MLNKPTRKEQLKFNGRYVFWKEEKGFIFYRHVTKKKFYKVKK